MLKKLLKGMGAKPATRAVTAHQAERENLTLEVSEAAEIAEKIFRRLDRKMKELAAIEKRVDEKREALERMLVRAENLKPSAGLDLDPKYREVRNLARKGLKIDDIAGILDIPRGEIELILTIDK